MKRELKTLYARVNKLIGCFHDFFANMKFLLWRTFVNCLYGVGLWKLGVWEKMYIRNIDIWFIVHSKPLLVLTAMNTQYLNAEYNFYNTYK